MSMSNKPVIILYVGAAWATVALSMHAARKSKEAAKKARDDRKATAAVKKEKELELDKEQENEEHQIQAQEQARLNKAKKKKAASAAKGRAGTILDQAGTGGKTTGTSTTGPQKTMLGQ